MNTKQAQFTKNIFYVQRKKDQSSFTIEVELVNYWLKMAKRKVQEKKFGDSLVIHKDFPS